MYKLTIAIVTTIMAADIAIPFITTTNSAIGTMEFATAVKDFGFLNNLFFANPKNLWN
jgi:hypothetical protein